MVIDGRGDDLLMDEDDVDQSWSGFHACRPRLHGLARIFSIALHFKIHDLTRRCAALLFTICTVFQGKVQKWPISPNIKWESADLNTLHESLANQRAKAAVPNQFWINHVNTKQERKTIQRSDCHNRIGSTGVCWKILSQKNQWCQGITTWHIISK